MALPATADPADRSTDAIFPLPLVPFERFMLKDDRGGYPIVYAFRLHFGGQIDREAFAEGVRFASGRHPLLRSVVKGRRWIATDQVPPIYWHGESDPLEPAYAERIDLSREIGVQIFVRQGPQHAAVVFRFHHATCDAMGAYRFFEDLLARYHELVTGESGSLALRELDLERLRTRSTFGLTPPPAKEQIKHLFTGLRESATYYRRAPQPLAAPQPYRKEGYFPPGQEGFATVGIDETLYRQLRKAAKHAGANLNDLLLRDLFLTARTWNAEHGKGDDRDWLQLMMPCGLREGEDKTMPAANVMSYAFLTHRAGEGDDPARLLSELVEATEAIRKYRLSLYFIGAIATVDAVPGLLHTLMRLPRCFATTVLTNVGDPSRRFSVRFPRENGLLRIGNLLLEDIDGAPPVRPRTRAGFSAHTYGGRMRLGIRCDRHHFTLEDMQRLLDSFLTQLTQTAGANEG